MKKKILLVLSIVAILACVLAISVSAAEPSYADGEWIYANDGTTKLAIRDTDGNPLIWYMNGEELKYVRADQTDTTQSVYVKYSISAGGSGFDAEHTPTACLKDIDIYDNGTQIEGATINSQIVLLNIQELEVDAFNGWLFGNKNGCCLLMRGIVFPNTLKYLGTEGFTNHRFVQMWNLENTKLEWFSTSNSNPFASPQKTLTQEATNYTLKFPDTLTIMPGLEKVQVKTVIFSPNSVDAYTYQVLRECSKLERVYIPAGIVEKGFHGEGVRSTIGFIMFFTGTEEQANALVENSANSYNHNDHLKDSRTKIVSYANYLENKDTYENDQNSIYIVYGTNKCLAFYDNKHTYDETVDKTFTDENFLSSCEITTDCTVCLETVKIDTLDPLFKSNGFASNTGAMMQSFAVNKALIESYQLYFGEIKFGLVAAYCGTGTDFDTTSGVLVNADGTGVNNKIAIVDFTEREYDIFEMRISGIDDSTKDKEFYICAYVIENGAVSYIHNNTTADKAEATTYAAVAALDNTKYDYLPVTKEEE